MPAQRLSMRRIREVLRLRHQGLTERIIARMIGVSNGVVHGYLRRARLMGLSWPLPEGMDDEDLELLLFPVPIAASQSNRRVVPDWIYVEKELRRRSVTRLLSGTIFRAANPDGLRRELLVEASIEQFARSSHCSVRKKCANYFRHAGYASI